MTKTVHLEELEKGAKPKPPEDLNPAEAAEWMDVVNRMAADWFPRETHGLLAQYCRHVVQARRIAKFIHDIEVSEQPDFPAWDKLLKMQERESRAIATLSTKMRLAQQSTIDKETKKQGVGRKPWEFDGQ